jgi:predicted dehydrogenase
MPQNPARRDFLKKTAAAAAGAVVTGLTIEQSAYAGGGDVLRIALIGCGQRGTGAAAQALRADPNVKLVALADAFEDRIQKCLDTLAKEEDVRGKVDVKKEHRYVGFDAYKGAIDSADVVLLCSPPGFRPLHIKAAVAKNRHIFAEKPIAVDAPGVRSVLAACEEAAKKGLSVVSGLCLRYDNGFKETVRRIHGGAIGDVLTLQANDYRGPIWVKPRQPDWTDMHWQMRNWYYFTWLSGDFNVEQHVHYLDVCAWVMKGEYPKKCVGMGGRQVRTEPEYGHIYDHFSVIYEYADGARLFSNCRQQTGCKNDMSAQVVGTKGRANFAERKKGLQITSNGSTWIFDGPPNEMYQTEHDELFASIRKSKPINNGEYMCKSTQLAIMARMAAYTGQEIGWQQAWDSKEDLTPARYEWGPIATPPVAIPGVTKFV